MTILTNNLMYSIVGRGQADLFVKIAQDCGVSGGTVVQAMGTASSSILRLLGLGDKSKEIVLNVVDIKKAHAVIEKAKADPKIMGVSAILGSGSADDDISAVSKAESGSAEMPDQDGPVAGTSQVGGKGEGTMDKKWKMITIIVNKGYADDIMDTARKVGASGGTVTNARGTAPKGQEERFLGITIVPEKEMIFILAERSEADGIVDAIQKMDCLQEKGIGIIFTQDVVDFVNLGGK